MLDPVNSVQQVHAIVFAGGSAFGLDGGAGVMRYLEEREIGFLFGPARVPIVPGAALFDLHVGDPLVRPTAACGYLAAQSATSDPVSEGNVGAGAGATIGKALGMDRAMKAGVGTAAVTMTGGLVVAAMVVVNAFGDVVDPATGRTVAGVRGADGRVLADARKLLRAGLLRFEPGNTTLGVVATNAALTKTEATRVAQMAHDGFARAIAPEPYPGGRRRDLRPSPPANGRVRPRQASSARWQRRLSPTQSCGRLPRQMDCLGCQPSAISPPSHDQHTRTHYCRHSRRRHRPGSHSGRHRSD